MIIKVLCKAFYIQQYIYFVVSLSKILSKTLDISNNTLYYIIVRRHTITKKEGEMPHVENSNITIKLGADPEFQWFDGDHSVDASRVTPRAGTSRQLGTDGCSSTGEIRPNPGKPMEVFSSINHLIKQASRYHYDMYAGSGRTAPTGGHIHFSGINHTPELLQKLDKFIAIPLNEVSDRSHRSSYGAMSEVRTQPHGWEYRSPCSWIVHPIIAKGVLRVAWVLAIAQTRGALSGINTIKDLKRFGKTCDNRVATDYNIREFYQMLENMKRNNIKLEHVEVFQAWKKRERPTAVAENVQRPVRRVIPRVAFNTEDFNMPSVIVDFQHVVEDSHVEIDMNHTAHVYGASIARTDDLVVYVPRGHNIQNLPNRAELEGVRYEEWENGYFGLSYNIRRLHPTLAARALYAVLVHDIVDMPNTANVAMTNILNTIEGRR